MEGIKFDSFPPMKPQVSLLLFVLLGMLGQSSAAESPPLKVFVLVGQSNMVGKRCRPAALLSPHPVANAIARTIMMINVLKRFILFMSVKTTVPYH